MAHTRLCGWSQTGAPGGHFLAWDAKRSANSVHATALPHSGSSEACSREEQLRLYTIRLVTDIRLDAVQTTVDDGTLWNTSPNAVERSRFARRDVRPPLTFIGGGDATRLHDT